MEDKTASSHAKNILCIDIDDIKENTLKQYVIENYFPEDIFSANDIVNSMMRILDDDDRYNFRGNNILQVLIDDFIVDILSYIRENFKPMDVYASDQLAMALDRLIKNGE